MNPSLQPADYASAEQMAYTVADACFAYLERHGEAAAEDFSDELHTLMAYIYLDSQVQEGGFLQLIASGYGEYVLENPLADSLRRWKIKSTPKIVEAVRTLYREYGADIESAAGAGADLDALRAQFGIFEEWDGAYYDAAEADLQAAADYIAVHPAKFRLPDGRAGKG
ncbi:DUF4375 domain-containing protein [Neisseria leonii]|uniref:DMP19 family protein n=1 Tax=Neisseria leonii TaxID=2995413 RepID=A0A9X4IDW1_9NEIS|nr:DUF4375 domain-containing protein [Neisseria sp. 51.81]MDD9327538.1 DMP19 family protein [Neisseria sp. 51.81]